MDTLVIDAAAAMGGVALLMAFLFRSPKDRRSAPPSISAVAHATRRLRRRHRRAVRSLFKVACEVLEHHVDGSFESFTARETLQAYLPETLAAYLIVPRSLRKVRHSGHSSADDELSRQLDILLVGLERIREADAAAGASRMEANGAFLNERFAAPHRRGAPERRSVISEFVDKIEVALPKF